MRKVIAALNMTLDGYCDHTAGVIADDELHQHYAELLYNAGILLYGRITFELMHYWKELLEHPSDEPTMNNFAASIDRVDKLVFSHTLKDIGWNTARLASHPLEEEVRALKQQPGKDIFIGSRSLIVQLLNSHLIDELQICIHPVIEGKGLPMFAQVKDRIDLKLHKTKALLSGAIVFYYGPADKRTPIV
jgi:dihydrofolate reductase